MRVSRLLCLACACLLLAGCAGAFQPTTTDAVRLDTRATVGQTFVADEPVRGVDLLIATFAEEPVDGELRVRLRDGLGGPVVASTDVAAEALADNAWATVRFAEPATVAGQAVVELRWDGDTPLGVYANAPADDERCGADRRRLCNDPYAGGTLLVDGDPAHGDLAFRAVTGGGALPGAVSDAVARLGDAPLFALTWPLALLGSAALAVAGFRRRA